LEEPYVCPWKCLIPPNDQPSIQPKASKSFLQALSHGVVAPTLSQLPKPCEEGDSLAITIPKDSYKEGLRGCNLISMEDSFLAKVKSL